MTSVDPEIMLTEHPEVPSEAGYPPSATLPLECDQVFVASFSDSFQTFIYSILMPAVCVPGVLGACICIVVFTKKQMRSSLNIYLAGLSVFDLILLTMSLLIYPLMSACIQQGNRGAVCHVFWRSSLFTFPMSLIAQTGSVWTCVAITVDRFLAVKYPLHMRLWCTPHRAFCVLSCITAISIIYKLPSMFELSLDECGKLTPTSLRNHPLYIVIYNTYGYVLLLIVIPWLIIIILNVITVNAVRTAYKIRREITTNSRSDDSDRRCTKMATVTIVAFILLNSLAGLNNIIEAFNFKASGNQSRITIGNLLVCLNSASNILIYSIFGRKFRKMAVQLICPCTEADYHQLSRNSEHKVHTQHSQKSLYELNAHTSSAI